jgi:hypothetical protein
MDPRLEMTLKAGIERRNKLLEGYKCRLEQWVDLVLFARIEDAQEKGAKKIKIYPSELPDKPEGLRCGRFMPLVVVAERIRLVDGLKIKYKRNELKKSAKRYKLIVRWPKGR